MRKIVYALLSVVVAFGLWFYVITTVNPGYEETFYDIPVALANESALYDRGLMLDTEKIPTVTLKLSGNRSDIIKLNKSNITLVADLSRIYESGRQRVAYSISFPGDIPSNSIEILSKSVVEITLDIAKRNTAQIPVVPVYKGSVPDGFRTDKESLVLDKEYITVTGPAALVDKIEEARIEVDLNEQTETIKQSYRYTFYDENGNVIESEKLITDVTEVNLTLKIQRYKEIALKLDVTYGGGSNRNNTLITFSTQSIQVSGSEQLLDALGDKLVLGSLKLGELLEDTELEYEIKLPEGIENLTGKKTVTVTVKFNNLVTQTFQVTDIQTRNVPEGMDVELITQELTVTVRGPQAQIDQLTEEDLVVIVDFSQAELGTDTYKAQIQVDATQFGAVGAVGSYLVDAKLTQAPEEPAEGE